VGLLKLHGRRVFLANLVYRIKRLMGAPCTASDWFALAFNNTGHLVSACHLQDIRDVHKRSTNLRDNATSNNYLSTCAVLNVAFLRRLRPKEKVNLTSARGAQGILTRPKIMRNSPKDTSLHTYDNIASRPSMEMYFQAFIDAFQVFPDVIRG